MPAIRIPTGTHRNRALGRDSERHIPYLIRHWRGVSVSVWPFAAEADLNKAIGLCVQRSAPRDASRSGVGTERLRSVRRQFEHITRFGPVHPNFVP